MTTYYASPAGGTGAGAIGSPWSITHAASGAGGTLVPGDIVLLRGGTYSAPAGLTFTPNGTASLPITYAAYPNEIPVIDGSLTAYTTIGNSNWTLHDAGTNTYKTTATGYGVLSFGGHIKIGSRYWPLATHKNLTGLMAATQDYRLDGDYYMGPGILEDALGGQVYIRLTNPSSIAQKGRTTVTVADLDPRNNEIRISANNVAGVTVTGNYLSFTDIVINDFYQALSVGGSSTVFTRCSGRFGYWWVRSGATATQFIDCIVDGLMDAADYYVAWHDVKSGITNADGIRKNAYELSNATNVLIRGGTIARVFDGILASFTHHVEVDDVDFTNVWDDAWQMYANIYQINMHGCRFFGAGPSHDQSGSSTANPDPGTVFIHHNIIDTTIHPIFVGRNATALDGDSPTKKEGMSESVPFSTHGTATVYGFPWKVYYNTIKSGGHFIDGYVDFSYFGRAATNHYPGHPHEAYNNILDVSVGYALGRDFDSNTGNEIYDGNVYWGWSSNYLWRFLHTSVSTLDAEGVGATACATVAGMKASQAFTDSKVYYPPGWENSGLQVNPNLNGSYIPVTSSVLTGAVDLSLKGWPGTEGYQPERGAIGTFVVSGLPSGRRLRSRQLVY